jgi:hypothetical protein
MNENQTTPDEIELCTIRIAFPVETDEQAIGYKKKISEVLADIPQVRIEFSLNNVPIPIRANAPSTTKLDK